MGNSDAKCISLKRCKTIPVCLILYLGNIYDLLHFRLYIEYYGKIDHEQWGYAFALLFSGRANTLKFVSSLLCIVLYSSYYVSMGKKEKKTHQISHKKTLNVPVANKKIAGWRHYTTRDCLYAWVYKWRLFQPTLCYFMHDALRWHKQILWEAQLTCF